MDTTTLMAARQEQIRLDEEIARLENDPPNTSKTTILLLKHQRNACTPILMIPNELLLQISLAVRRAVTGLSSWHRITQICRHWRTLVVETAEFWTSPPEHSLDYARLALERSKNAPLDVVIFRRDSSRTVPLLLKHLQRIQSMSLYGLCDIMDLAQSSVADLDVEASLLKTLTIYHHNTINCQHTFSIAAFRPTSALRSLSLMMIKFDWDVFPLTGLTDLSLVNIGVSAPVSGDRFTHALRQMPLLATLELSFSDIRLFNYPTNSGGILHFPEVKKLVIRHPSPQHQCEGFLAQARMPRLQELAVDWETGTTDSEWRPGALHQVSRSIANGNFLAFEELQFYSNSFHLKHVLPKPSLRLPGDLCVYVNLPFYRYSSLDNVAVMEEVILPLLSRSLDGSSALFSTLVRLRLYYTLNLTASQMIHLFGFLPSLEVVGISDVMLLTQALQVPSPPELALPFSTIRSLEWYFIRTAGFGSGVHHELDSDELENFCACITQRTRLGFTIDSLKLPDCIISSGQQETLKSVFASVHANSTLY